MAGPNRMRGLRPQTATDRYGNPGANAHGTPKHTIASEYFQSSEYKRGCHDSDSLLYFPSQERRHGTPEG